MGRPHALAPAILALLLCAAQTASGAAATAGLFRRGADAGGAASPHGPRSISVTVDLEALRDFRLSGGGRLALPGADGADLVIALERFEALAPGAVVTLTGDTGPVSHRPDLVFFKGRVEGEPGSLALFAMSPRGVTGRILRDSGWLLVVPRAPGGPAEGSAPGHVIVPEADLPAPPSEPVLDNMQDMVGQHRDKQMRIGAALYLMKIRPEPQRRL